MSEEIEEIVEEDAPVVEAEVEQEEPLTDEELDNIADTAIAALKDILKYFDGRIASKMLLGEAIDRNLLSTFQYFGVTDEVDYRKCKWVYGKYDTSELEKIYTADRKRCAFVPESVNRYVTDMDEVKKLGFCVSVNHRGY